MCNARASVVYSAALLLLVLHSVVALVSAQGSTAPSPWPTLSGDAPIVIARGGFSGLFPDSSSSAFTLALITSLPNVVLWCDVRLTKDAAGICFPDIKLENASDISSVLKDKDNTYPVNGISTKAFFSVDFTLKDLSNVVLTQGIYSRTSSFDGNLFPILTVEDVATQFKPPGLWLNIQHDAFYTQHKLSMRSYVLAVSRRVVVNYISSPEVGFLKSIVTRFSPKTTKLIFRFLGKDEIEPSTNQTYGSLLTNLTFIKTFASGILVPKTYIWPVDAAMYLQPHTTLVSDAHKAELEVHASDFMNDASLSYDYRYDPLAEYLSFIDNGNFSVDGVLSDFPITPSEAIDCFSHLGKNASAQVKTLVISKNGASGDYPGCTDMAYNTAISDGVDILDCSVQMAKDGTPFCSVSMNLMNGTTVAQSEFSNRSVSIPEINAGRGIYAFSLTWDEIQTLTPSISNPYPAYRLFRNPKNRNKGKLLSLADFLALTKNTSSLMGVLIGIENAAYLAENQGLSVTDAVLDALSKAGYDNTTTQKVMIQSTNSSVLMKFKKKSNYELVYQVDETIRDALLPTIDDIKSFAGSVVVGKASVFPVNQAFLTGSTDIVAKLKKANLSVYVETFRNEFISQAWDFFSDATVEINSYVQGAEVDGIISEFPKTAVTYRKNQCLNLGKDTPMYMGSVQPGTLMQLITTQYLPPAEAPYPVLTESDVAEAPLPPVSAKVPSSSSGGTATPPTASNGQPKTSACLLLLSLAFLLGSLILF